MEEHKFLIYGRSMAFITIVTSCLLIIGALIVIIFNIIAGCCFLATQLAITACILYFNPIFIIFNEVNIKTKTIFGKVKKSLNWSYLKRIELKILHSGGRHVDNFIILFFTDEKIVINSCEEANKEDLIILMTYRKGIEEILKKYTKIDIENMI